MLKVVEISNSELNEIKVEDLKSAMASGKIFIVKNYLRDDILNYLERKIEILNKLQPTWMPLDDDCVDYHRINNEYQGSFVRAKTHSFMFHFYNGMNQELLEKTKHLWLKKLEWRGVLPEDYQKHLLALPSSGYIPRVVSHLYPSGGGYLARHSDPVNENNVLQTLIVGSQRGHDFQTGGLNVYSKSNDSFIYVDEFIDKGDMIMFDQSFEHEVTPIDNQSPLDWDNLNGRLSHVLLFTRSDYLKGKVPDVLSKV